MKRPWLISIVLAVLLLGWFMVRPAVPREPSYHGRKLSQWLNDYKRVAQSPKKLPDDAATKQAAKDALRKMGTNAIPSLLQWLQTKNAPFKITLNSLLSKQHYLRFRFQDAEHMRQLACLGFEFLGDDASPALPALVQLMQSPNQDELFSIFQCIDLITNDQKVLYPSIIELLHSSNEDDQYSAAAILVRQYCDQREQAYFYKRFPGLESASASTVDTNAPATK